jgi:polyhydroxybutyrate depolymerase
MIRRFISVLLAFVLIASACSSNNSANTATATADSPAETDESTASESDVAADDAADETAVEADPTPTEEPAPAATPEPEPTVAPEPACSALEPGTNEIELTVNGDTHQTFVFVPSSYDGATPMPTVLNWHGRGSNGAQQIAYSAYQTLAEEEGFMVVHPTALVSPGDTATTWELIDDQDKTRDDLGFADGLIDELIANWCADANRIYTTGMSNGGFFSARLVCERAERIAGAVSVAGTYHLDDCEPSRPVPYLAFHGTDDETVPFNGSGWLVMPDEFAEFAVDFGCDAEAATETIGTDVIRHNYTNCDNGIAMSFFEITDGGHTWPGSALGPALVDIYGYQTMDVDATVLGWEFMSQFSLDS